MALIRDIARVCKSKNAGPFELTVPVQRVEGGELPPLLRTHTVLGLDAGADAPRVAIRNAALVGGGA